MAQQNLNQLCHNQYQWMFEIEENILLYSRTALVCLQ